ncbi:MBL fold metallo-hydrolase [Chryseobacterium sp. BIGb0232]|uniref:MBL fold metallo-hydrolase n=1 Tax=Chryseobacterium sp. BIGb0232 TaxID=2940598 RepID=UPI000F4643E0|nr:MBL fold metallo-hydrolase [Chryseobacterium sp. BIGb0232]MCS4305140.1 L-ascorbate metabolism protein UlaG (beta-lactamase superfamily) [Chryseobacterium sp. BIGb0232]ROS07711.1 L-ascorbate metabolism protein UlaG (beta-lactamase superfamily) [Chryseobacterium nakagawai]
MNLVKQLGQFPDEKRKEYFSTLPNYANGRFHNILITPPLLEGESMTKALLNSLCKVENTSPKSALPFVITDLKTLDPEENVLVWFGHSSYFIQVDGKKFLIDPVFSGNASPMPGSIKAFPGADYYKPEHMPYIDFLLISHDHWDHLDYKTVEELKDKVETVICGLGTGQHFEYWGWEPKYIIEKNWWESVDIADGFRITLTPARHFSGRLLNRNISLWTSFVLKTPAKNLFLGGDSGYGNHFTEIGEKYGPFDLAVMECGQYNEKWPYIHTLPDQLIGEIKELKAKNFIPVHHSKFKLAQHPWFEPVELAAKNAEDNNQPITLPLIGEKVDLDQLGNVTWKKWWEEYW